MLINTFLLSSSILITLLRGALAVPTTVEIDPYGGKPMSLPTWNGDVGGSNINLTGTIESIKEQILKISPTYFEDKAAKSVRNRETGFSLEKRGISAWPPNCGVAGNYALSYAIRDRVTQLYGLPGDNFYIAQRSCATVACLLASKIAVCNDKYTTLTVPIDWVGDYAAGIVDYCDWFDWFTGDRLVKGQLFDIDGSWNIIVKWENSC